MNRLASFYQLPAQDRRLILHAGLWVAAVRLGLSLLPFRAVLRLVPATSSSSKAETRATPERISRVVSEIARDVPGASCLTQALATRALLSRRGYESELRIGVARKDTGDLEAHAWLLCDGTVIIGEGAMHDFTPFPSLNR